MDNDTYSSSPSDRDTQCSSAHSSSNLPDGFSLEHNVVSPKVWATIKNWLSTDSLPSSATFENHSKHCLLHVPIPWETGNQMQGRKIAQFGNCKYDYIDDVAITCNDLFDMPPIPEYILQTLLKNDKRNNQQHQYTQCIINMYEAEHSIPWHLDHEYFGPEVLVYTFGEDRPLLFRKKVVCNDRKNADGNNSTVQDEIENAGDIEAQHEGVRFVHTHAYPRHGSKYILYGLARDLWEHSVPRGRGERVSITFRSWLGPH